MLTFQSAHRPGDWSASTKRREGTSRCPSCRLDSDTLPALLTGHYQRRSTARRRRAFSTASASSSSATRTSCPYGVPSTATKSMFMQTIGATGAVKGGRMTWVGTNQALPRRADPAPDRVRSRRHRPCPSRSPSGCRYTTPADVSDALCGSWGQRTPTKTCFATFGGARTTRTFGGGAGGSCPLGRSRLSALRESSEIVFV